ncbi:MAG: 2-C-methyl-D-erythritol 4-phosphate cytidylyltransferase [Bacteroidales bacterium]|nr:2-C-methyl-D-erythritol 4-phosphate cytidylyltransferase [Bacteroidales bacterium]
MVSSVIIVAGGAGVRMGRGLPKQFRELDHQPVLMHSIRAFHTWDPSAEIVVVLPEGFKTQWLELCATHRFAIPHHLTTGGLTRFQSVKKGLDAMTRNGLVGIHDAVRPLIQTGTIERLFTAASEKGCAVPFIRPRDSVRWEDEKGSHILNRKQIRLIQTPQVFQSSLLKIAYRQDEKPEFTDDASVWEATGYTVHLIEGQPSNLKITHEDDLKLAEQLIHISHE